MTIVLRNLHEKLHHLEGLYQNNWYDKCCFPTPNRLRLIVDKNHGDFMIVSRSHAGSVMGEESENGF